MCFFFLIFYIFSKIIKYPGKIREICQFSKLSWKIPKIPENSRISGEVETLLGVDESSPVQNIKVGKSFNYYMIMLNLFHNMILY